MSPAWPHCWVNSPRTHQSPVERRRSRRSAVVAVVVGGNLESPGSPHRMLPTPGIDHSPVDGRQIAMSRGCRRGSRRGPGCHASTHLNVGMTPWIRHSPVDGRRSRRPGGRAVVVGGNWDVHRVHPLDGDRWGISTRWCRCSPWTGARWPSRRCRLRRSRLALACRPPGPDRRRAAPVPTIDLWTGDQHPRSRP